MALSQEQIEERAEAVREEAERIARDLPIVLLVGDKRIDIDEQWVEGDEIYISVAEPLFEQKTGKTYSVMETGSLEKAFTGFRKMAV